MNLYTRSGDDGTTGLFGGPRVRKDDDRVDAYGTVDELNAALGLVAAGIEGTSAFAVRLREITAALQSRLFDVGADLATPASSPHADKITRVSEHNWREAEAWIDEIDEKNPPMTHFVLPGGTELAARLHLARAICRRAERAMVHLASKEDVTNDAIVYVNRVSDLLFSMARRANFEAGVPDVPWVPGGG